MVLKLEYVGSDHPPINSAYIVTRSTWLQNEARIQGPIPFIMAQCRLLKFGGNLVQENHCRFNNAKFLPWHVLRKGWHSRF